MKLPVIKHLQRHNEVEKLKNAIEVLETFTEHRSVTEREMDVVGELITNLCGAVEVHQLIKSGESETDAANKFAKKVLGSIDR